MVGWLVGWLVNGEMQKKTKVINEINDTVEVGGLGLFHHATCTV